MEFTVQPASGDRLEENPQIQVMLWEQIPVGRASPLEQRVHQNPGGFEDEKQSLGDSTREGSWKYLHDSHLGPLVSLLAAGIGTGDCSVLLEQDLIFGIFLPCPLQIGSWERHDRHCSPSPD